MHIRQCEGAPSVPARSDRAFFLSFPFLFSIFAVLGVLGGCASPGEPVARKPLVPKAVADLKATQSGNDVVLTFTLPKETAESRPLDHPPAIEIYRDFEASTGSGATEPGAKPTANPTLLVSIPASLVDHYSQQGRIHYEDSLQAADFAKYPDETAIYMVRTRASTKRASADSNFADLRIYPTPDPISDVKAQITPATVVLTWTPPQKTIATFLPPVSGYRIYRAEAEPATPGSVSTSTGDPNTAESLSNDSPLATPLAKIGESESATFRDTQMEFGKTYVYSVRSIVQYSGEALESGASNSVVVTPKDVFPPAAPQGLVVVLVPGQGGVPAHPEMSWAIGPETDIGGYNVYREEVGTRGARANTDLLLTPAFRDMNVQPGHRYIYRVTAIDRSGNESAPGAAVSGDVPTEK